MTYELVLRGGTVVDGTGAPGYPADVAVDGGRIAAIGADLDGAVTLDASGHVVAPGFIDIHTHYDAQVFWDPALTPSCWHGVTSVVAGNCGFSLAPLRPEHQGLIRRTLKRVEDMDEATLEEGVSWTFETYPEYLAEVERRGTVLNFASYVGHTAVRMYVMGDDAYEREQPTDTELEAMTNVVRDALGAGAIGFSSSSSSTHSGDGGRPIPSRLARLDEVERLLQPLRELDVGVAQFTPGDHPVTHADLYKLQARVGRPFSWSALLAVDNSPLTGKQRELNAEGRAAGADVWPQVSCRPLTLQLTMEEPFSFNVAAAFRELMSGDRDARVRAYRDPAWRGRAETELERVRVLQEKWETTTIDESDAHPDLIGVSIAALSEKRGCSPLAAMLDVALDDDLRTRFGTVLANDDEAMVTELLNEDGVILGLSDAGAHVGMLCDACLPTDLLGNWVRGRGALSLEQAVHKLTGEPARIFGLEGRGIIAAGAAADVVVFDPATIGPGDTRRVRDFPANGERLVADSPTGIRHVLVNGVPITVDAEHRADAFDSRPGKILRGGKATR
jgi:N-acyl-D-amino-acid deacylase